MKPVNNKSMIAFLFGQMEKLDKKEVSVSEVMAQTKLAGQIYNGLNYELSRAKLGLEIHREYKNSGRLIEIREAESKGFDNTISQDKQSLKPRISHER